MFSNVFRCFFFRLASEHWNSINSPFSSLERVTRVKTTNGSKIEGRRGQGRLENWNEKLVLFVFYIFFRNGIALFWQPMASNVAEVYRPALNSARSFVNEFYDVETEQFGFGFFF